MESKKFKKILKWTLIVFLLIPVLGFAFLEIYVAWIHFQHPPKFPSNSCVEDVQVHRIHRIVGMDPLKDVCVSTIILKTGAAVSGTHSIGSEDCIMENDPNIHPVPCP